LSATATAEAALRVAILEVDPAGLSATGIRGRAMAGFLRARGHLVSVLHPPSGFLEGFARARISLRSRVARRLTGSPSLPHLWDALASALRPQIAAGGFDVVIGRGQHTAHATSGMSGFMKVLDAPNVEFLEHYYAAAPDFALVEATFDREEALLRDVHHVLLPHRLLHGFLVEAFPGVEGLERKLVTVGLGAEPARRHACFSREPRIVYAGSSYYFQDPLLLSRLAGRSPFPVDCYGPLDPNRRFLPTPLRYQGYARDADFLADYQFGLVTVSRDRLRQYSPVTKLAYYLMHGLPVLFPEWMREGRELPDCAVPYDEDTFGERVLQAASPARWESLAASARSAGAGRSWAEALKPLAQLLEAR
jgi:hypothetical protein